MLKFGKIALLLMVLLPTSVYSNWSRPYRKDDGGRIYISAKIGGVGIFSSKMENELGKDFTSEYIVIEPTTNNFLMVSRIIKDYEYNSDTALDTQNLNLGDSKPEEKLKSFSFYSSLALGFVVPEHPNWRSEFSWDHIAEFNYDASPMFNQTAYYIDSSSVLHSFNINTGAMTSTNKIDLYMLNFYHDFFDSNIKKPNEWIPYIGAGIGYASITTKMQLVDLYADLSYNAAIAAYGYTPTDVLSPTGLLDFYESSLQKGSLALSGMFGFSFGFTEKAFLDLGLKLTWIDKIHWGLTDSSSSTTIGSKNIIGSDSNFLTSAHVGLRLEF